MQQKFRFTASPSLRTLRIFFRGRFCLADALFHLFTHKLMIFSAFSIKIVQTIDLFVTKTIRGFTLFIHYLEVENQKTTKSTTCAYLYDPMQVIYGSTLFLFIKGTGLLFSVPELHTLWLNCWSLCIPS